MKGRQQSASWIVLVNRVKTLGRLERERGKKRLFIGCSSQQTRSEPASFKLKLCRFPCCICGAIQQGHRRNNDVSSSRASEAWIWYLLHRSWASRRGFRKACIVLSLSAVGPYQHEDFRSAYRACRTCDVTSNGSFALTIQGESLRRRCLDSALQGKPNTRTLDRPQT